MYVIANLYSEQTVLFVVEVLVLYYTHCIIF